MRNKAREGAVRSFMVIVLSMTSYVKALPIGAKSTTHERCSASGIAIYNMTFQTYWSRERFPKQYPTFRPHAQWSRVIGRTHSENYVLWRPSTLASPAVTEYAQTGETSLLDLERQGRYGVFDVFGGSSINSGAGQTSSAMFVDAAHPKVSLLAHLVPSPDWFVGLDGESLCSGDQWVSDRKLALRIWDAGTDKGYTFTAPNWSEIPQQPISEITSSIPSNVACGFYYPDVKELPTIAEVTFTKVRQVETRADEPQRDWHSLTGERISNEVVEEPKGVLVKSLPSRSHSPEGSNSVTAKTLHGVLSDPVVMTTTSRPSTKIGKKVTEKPSGATGLKNPVHKVGKKPKLSKEERRRLRRMNKGKKNGQRRNKKRKAKTGTSHTEKPKNVDCEVSAWGSWSPCSKTCGFGNRSRVRTVLQPSSGRGNRCPILTEDELCGTMRGCGWNYFSSDNWATQGK